MKLKVNVWQRQALIQLVGGTKGNIATLRKASKALDVLEMTQEEIEAVGLVFRPDGFATWKDTDIIYELEIKDKEAAGLVKRLFKTSKEWPANQALLVLDLAEQMGLTEEEAEE